MAGYLLETDFCIEQNLTIYSLFNFFYSTSLELYTFERVITNKFKNLWYLHTIYSICTAICVEAAKRFIKVKVIDTLLHNNLNEKILCFSLKKKSFNWPVLSKLWSAFYTIDPFSF